MKKMYAAVLVAVMAAGFVVPATANGPSHLIAVKALNKAKSANTKATTALTQLSAIRVVHADSGEVFGSPGDFARFDVPCPPGGMSVGFDTGLGALEPVAMLNYGTGYLGSYYNPSETTPYSGTLGVTCLMGVDDTTVRSARSKATAREQLAALEAAH